jgi:hypothetical protein
LLLTSSEFKQVSNARQLRNLLACNAGEDDCDPSLLEPDEANQVADKQHLRTLLLGEKGSPNGAELTDNPSILQDRSNRHSKGPGEQR